MTFVKFKTYDSIEIYHDRKSWLMVQVSENHHKEQVFTVGYHLLTQSLQRVFRKDQISDLDRDRGSGLRERVC